MEANTIFPGAAERVEPCGLCGGILGVSPQLPTLKISGRGLVGETGEQTRFDHVSVCSSYNS